MCWDNEFAPSCSVTSISTILSLTTSVSRAAKTENQDKSAKASESTRNKITLYNNNL